MEQTALINTMDFNFMDVLSHALSSDARLVIEYLFGYMDEQSFSMDNYNLIVMNLEELVAQSRGGYLEKFLDDAHQGTTLRILFDDENLDPNQFTTAVDYFKYDHGSLKGTGQVVQRFKEIIKGDKSADEASSESFKVQYAYLDFSAMMF